MIPRFHELDNELALSLRNDPFVWIRFQQETIFEQKIPDKPYPMRTSALDALLASGAIVSTVDIVRGLLDWLDFTDDDDTVAQTLREIIDEHVPPTKEKYATCEFEIDRNTKSRFQLGQIDFASPVGVWFRQELVIAIGCFSPIEQGLITVAVPHILTLKVAQSILDHTLVRRRQKHHGEITPFRPIDGNQGRYFDCALGQLWCAYPRNVLRIIHEREGNTILPLPSSDKWLAPNQVAALIAIGCGFLQRPY